MAVNSPMACIAVPIIFWAIAAVTLGLRIFVRLSLRPGVSWDDALIILAMVLYTVYVVQYVFGVYQYGIGKSEVSLDGNIYADGIRTMFVCEIMYCIASYMVKLSLILTFFHFAISSVLRMILNLLMAFGFVITVALILASCLLCSPLEYFWAQYKSVDSPGSCGNVRILMYIKVIQAVYVLMTDLSLGFIIPLILLRGLQMEIRTKVSVWLLLALGSLAGIATILRIPYLMRLSVYDRLQENNGAAFYSIIELGTGIICVSASTFKPLFVRLRFLVHSLTARKVEDDNVQLYNTHPCWIEEPRMICSEEMDLSSYSTLSRH